MKIVFVGPSLPDAQAFVGDDAIVVCGPALQGDVVGAARRGATVIGIIDGGFEYTAPIWHKEILYALSQGIAVFGGASMGALRAAECRAFGMVGVGRIFRDYESGAIVDDADVALVHAPAELGYQALSLPLVNVRATLELIHQKGQLSGAMRAQIEQAAAAIFFKTRTWRTVIDKCDIFNAPQRSELLALLVSNTVDQKRADAIELLTTLRSADKLSQSFKSEWKFNETFPM
jgi:hypothetical protein